MTSKETIDWMKKKDILKHWILPEKGLNKGTRYAMAPPGNAPELNALGGVPPHGGIWIMPVGEGPQGLRR
eukprot:8159977-Ditylum_brightwellii.AAC.1